MSFTQDIKQEIANAELKKHCEKAQLCALIQLTGSLTISNGGWGLLIRSENPTTAKRVVFLLKDLYSVNTNLQVGKKTNLKKNNVYTIETDEKVREILEDLTLMNQGNIQSHPSAEVVSKECCAKNYLAGAFLAYGSCNDPQNTNYHLEISLARIEHANFIVKLISRFDMQAKIVKRRSRYVVYMKKADYISDFLALIGAHDSMMRFEDERIARDLRNSMSRMDNCEIANEQKIIRAGERQVDYINKIVETGNFKKLPDKLKNVADIRLRYPESSLNELCDYYQKAYGEVVSKSGMKHRLNKIESFAEALEDEQ